MLLAAGQTFGVIHWASHTIPISCIVWTNCSLRFATTVHVCYSLVMSVLVLAGLVVSVAWDEVVLYAVHVMALEEWETFTITMIIITIMMTRVTMGIITMVTTITMVTMMNTNHVLSVMGVEDAGSIIECPLVSFIRGDIFGIPLGSGSGLLVPENSDFGSDQGPTRVPVSNCKHRECWLDHSWY